MSLDVFVKGLILGFSVAAPVGPIGVLCIRRTLSGGRLSGFVSGLGAAAADGLYGAIAAFGLSVVSNFLLGQKAALQLVGGAFLLYLGGRAFRSKPSGETIASSRKAGRGLASSFLTTFLLTVTNPMTILSFLGVFTGLGLASGGTAQRCAVVLVAGVVMGSALWWLVLSFLAGLFRERLAGSGLVWVNRLSGLLIASFGAVALWAVVRGLGL